MFFVFVNEGPSLRVIYGWVQHALYLYKVCNGRNNASSGPILTLFVLIFTPSFVRLLNDGRDFQKQDKRNVVSVCKREGSSTEKGGVTEGAKG